MIKKPFSMHIDVDQFLPATNEEKEYVVTMRPSSSFFKDGLRRFFKNPVATIALIVIVLITLASIILPMFWPYEYNVSAGASGGKSRDRTLSNLAPFEYSEEEQKRIEEGEEVFPHVFGTDKLGRDYFIRVVYGTRISLAVGFFASLIVLIIGLIVGSISGYCGGKVDLIIMRVVDVIYSLPDMLMVILLASVLNGIFKFLIEDTSTEGLSAAMVSFKTWFTELYSGSALEKVGPNIISLFIIFALLYWVSMARLIRGQILSLREQEYVLAARAMGARGGHIIRKHLIPNCTSVIFISTALQIPNAIFTESYLSFLGLGVNAPMPSLGSLAEEARSAIAVYPHRFIIPAVVIALIVLSLNLFGDGLRDAFDPKLND